MTYRPAVSDGLRHKINRPAEFIAGWSGIDRGRECCSCMEVHGLMIFITWPQFTDCRETWQLLYQPARAASRSTCRTPKLQAAPNKQGTPSSWLLWPCHRVCDLDARKLGRLHLVPARQDGLCLELLGSGKKLVPAWCLFRSCCFSSSDSGTCCGTCWHSVADETLLWTQVFLHSEQQGAITKESCVKLRSFVLDN